MYRLEKPEYLLLFLLVPIFLILYHFYKKWRATNAQNLADPQLLDKILPPSNRRLTTYSILLLSGLIVFISIALANPQIGKKSEKVKRRGVDVMIAVDVSNSMLADDIAPSRLERTKTYVQQLLDQLQDNRVGLIVFAGYAYLQMPLSTDFAAARLYLKTLNPDLIPQQGTAFAEAISLANNSFDKENEKHKALILISDGENHEDGASNIAKEAAEQGLIIHTIGVGTEAGAKIPDIAKRTYKTDETGSYVLSKLNETTLKNIADQGNGKYFSIAKGDDPFSVVREINLIEKKDFEARVFTDFEDQFTWFVFTALILNLVLLFQSSKLQLKNLQSLKAIRWPKAGIFLVIGFMVTGTGTTVQANTPNRLIAQGNKHYDKSEYSLAVGKYLLAIEKQNSYNAAYNCGTSYIPIDSSYEQALTKLKNALALSNNDTEKSKAHYNIGHCLFLKNDLRGAYNAFKQALLLNPMDEDARYNLAFLHEQLKNQPPPSEEDQKEQDQEQNQEQQDQEQEKNKESQQDQGEEGKQDQQEQQDQQSQNQEKDSKNKEQNKNQNSKNSEQKDDKKNGGGKQDEKDPNKQKEEGATANQSDQENQSSEGKPGQVIQMKKEDALRLLDAMRNEELKTQEKMMKLRAKTAPSSNKRDKDW